MPFVWKCTEFGYDGKVKVIRQISDLDELPNVEWRNDSFKNELYCAEIHQEK
jgi:5-(carboxyamino)imidazole ribonucleotide synthase